MNYLQMCQRVRKEAGGVAGTSSSPSAVTNQTGQLSKIVSWVNDAWVDLQLKHSDWLWKRKSFTLALSASDNDYSASDASVTDLGEWDDETFRIYATATGVSDETFLSRMEYGVWRDIWNIGSQTPGRPQVVTIKPNLHLGFGPVSDTNYVVSGEYLQSAQELSADANEPDGLPAEFHMCIVYRALEKYAADESAPEVYAIHRDNHLRMESKLERKQLPRWRTAGPLA